jgi:hypothetical protein
VPGLWGKEKQAEWYHHGGGNQKQAEWYLNGGGKQKLAEWYHHGGGKEKKADCKQEWYHKKGGKEKQAVYKHARYHEKGGKEKQAVSDKADYHSEEGVLSRKNKKKEAADAIIAANEGRGYQGLGSPTKNGSYKIQFTNFLNEKKGVAIVLTVADVDAAALVFAKIHEVRAQLLGEAYRNDKKYKKALAQSGHNGTTYGELGSDAAKQVLLYAAQVLERKLPAGKYEGGWYTGWCTALAEARHRGSQ